MPFYLREANIASLVTGLQSILIVPCGFCPAVSLAVKNNEPYLKPFRKFLRTESYESFIQDLRGRLEQNGIETVVFDIKLPHHYVACMWTYRRRRELSKRAAEFEGVVVLGCEATVEIVRDAIRSTGCRVISGMEGEGIMNVVPTVSFPFNISLEVQGITPVIQNESKKLA